MCEGSSLSRTGWLLKGPGRDATKGNPDGVAVCGGGGRGGLVLGTRGCWTLAECSSPPPVPHLSLGCSLQQGRVTRWALKALPQTQMDSSSRANPGRSRHLPESPVLSPRRSLTREALQPQKQGKGLLQGQLPGKGASEATRSVLISPTASGPNRTVFSEAFRKRGPGSRVVLFARSLWQAAFALTTPGISLELPVMLGELFLPKENLQHHLFL